MEEGKIYIRQNHEIILNFDLLSIVKCECDKVCCSLLCVSNLRIHLSTVPPRKTNNFQSLSKSTTTTKYYTRALVEKHGTKRKKMRKKCNQYRFLGEKTREKEKIG